MVTQIQKSQWRRFLLAPLLIGVALTLTACPGENKSKRVSGAGGTSGCPTCINPGAEVLVKSWATHEDINHYFEFGLQLHATSPGAPGAMYNGPVTTSGYVFVEWNRGSCPTIPAGMYTIRTLPANGTFASDRSVQAFNLVNHNFEIVHSAGAVARVHVSYLDFFNDVIITGLDKVQYPQGMYGEVTITPQTAIPGLCTGAVKMFLPRPI